MLTDALPEDFNVHFKKRLIKYEVKDGHVALRFADGTTASADLLVGADGIGSATRTTMYHQLSAGCAKSNPAESKRLAGFIHPAWTGTYAYRALIDPNRLILKSSSHQATKAPMIVRFPPF